MQVTVEDSFGVTVTSGSWVVSLSLASNPGGSVLGGQTSVTTNNGVATFTDLTLNSVASGYTLSAQTASLSTASGPFSVSAPAPVQLRFVSQPTDTLPDVPFLPPVRVEVVDATGTLISSASNTITLSLGDNPGGASLTGTTVSTAVNGVATFSGLRVHDAGTIFTIGARYTLIASAATVPSETSVPFDVKSHWLLKIPTGTPGSPAPRYGHAAAFDGSRMFVFGGSTFTTDLSAWDVTTGAWTTLIPDGQPGSPPPRYYPTMVWTGSKVLLTGGYGSSGLFNDVWSYDPLTNAWTQALANGAAGSPTLGVGSVMVWDGTRAILWGGTYATNDLWWYDPTANAWTQKIANGDPQSPPGRAFPLCAWDGNAMLMLGGLDSDLWAYSPLSNTWTQVLPTGLGVPSNYYRSEAMTWDGHELIYESAVDGSGPGVQTWHFDPVTATWSLIVREVAPESPPWRNYPTLLWTGDAAILFAGGAVSSPDKNDLWLYTPVPIQVSPIPAGPIAPPTNLTVTPLDSTHTSLMWTNGSTLTTSFEIQRSVAGTGAFTTIATVSSSMTSYVDAQASPETQYHYRIVAVTTLAPATNSTSTVVATMTGPSAPTSLIATVVNATRIDLRWTNNATTQTGYVVLRRLAGTTLFSQIGPVLASGATTFTDTVAGGTSYEYEVVAKSLGAPSSPSNIAAGTTPPVAPVNVYVAANVGGVVLSWNRSHGATSYTVYRDTVPGVTPQSTSPGFVVTNAANTPTFLESLTPGTVYYFVVQATGPGGTSVLSAEVSVTAPTVTPVPAPTVHTINVTLGSVGPLVVDRMRRRLFVLDQSVNQVVAIDLATETVIGTVQLSKGAAGLCLSPNCRYLAAVCAPNGRASAEAPYNVYIPGTGDLFLIDPSTLAVVHRTSVEVDALDVQILDTGHAYVPGYAYHGARIAIHDALVGTYLGMWGIPSFDSFTRSPDGSRIYAHDYGLSPPSTYAWVVGDIPGKIDPLDAASGWTWDEHAHVFTPTSDGRRGLLGFGRGAVYELGTRLGDPLFVTVHEFGFSSLSLVEAADPKFIYGFAQNGGLTRYDVYAFTSQGFPGYDGSTLGGPGFARLGPQGKSIILGTWNQKLVVIPTP